MAAARDAALAARAAADAALGAELFPQEWAAAQGLFDRGEEASAETAGGAREAAGSFLASADAFSSIEERSAPLAAARMEGALASLAAELARAEAARAAAQAARAAAHFPADWRDAEAALRDGRAAPRGSAQELDAGRAMLAAAAAAYEDLERRSRPLFEREEAQRAHAAAAARADRSRRAAATAGAEGFFPSEWGSAEAHFAAGSGASGGDAQALLAGAARLGSAADIFDDIARRAGPLLTAARNEANALLQAATARADASRNSAVAVEASAHFPAEWSDVEARNAAARRARRTTPEEMRDAAAQLNAVAAVYDSLAQRSGPLFARERGPAESALQAAMARAAASRAAAVAADAAAHLPAEWRAAEAQNTAANRARRATTAEMVAAAPLFNAAADSYDSIAQRAGPVAAAAAAEADAAFRAALARADRSRAAAASAGGQALFAADWNRAEGQSAAGRSAPRETAAQARSATAQLNAAADGFDSIAARAIAARDREQAGAALAAARDRADRSRDAAASAGGQALFPADWAGAEDRLRAASAARTVSADEARSAAALFAAAAQAYDDIARRGNAAAAAARNDANREFQAAQGRADRSRRAALDAEGQANFPADWDRAEAQNVAGRSAPRTTPDETLAAAAQLNSAADAFDSIASRSAPIFARALEAANGALQAAMARAAASRAAAMEIEAQTLFPNEWRAAEAQNTAANRARRTTPEEMRSATALFATAADAYDGISRAGAPMFAAQRNEAASSLQAAVARAAASRQAAASADAQENFPRDWTNLETRHRTADSARRETIAEMRSAASLYVGVADGFDGLAQRSVALSAQNEGAAAAARANAERERQLAVEARADIAVRDAFASADAALGQGASAFSARNFTAAVAQFNQSASQFAASAREAERRRLLADATVEEARQRREESAAFAIATGLALEE
jgi:hypothetical protein